MSLQSPLGRALGHGSAKSGSSHWYAQRVTSVALLLLGLWFAVSLACLGGMSYELVYAWLGIPRNSVLMVLLVAAAAYHAALGLQIVVEDYVAAKLLRAGILVIVRFVLAAAAVTAVMAVLRVGSGVAA